MTLHWADIAVLLGLILAGCTATFFLLEWLIRKSALSEQAEMQRKLHSLTNALHSLEARLAELRGASVAASPMPQGDLNDIAIENPIKPGREEIAPEILAAITAAAHGFLGRHSRVRSVRALPSQQGVSPWSQQGRVVVQASHNLRARR